jgi:hypothetical protein
MREDKTGKKANRPSPAGSVKISRRHLLGTTSLIAASAIASTALSRATSAASQDDNVLPKPQPPFAGKIERTSKGSTPDFPQGVEAPAGDRKIMPL